MSTVSPTQTAHSTPDGKPTMKSLTVIGKRWFHRAVGNTYHTVEIIVDGTCVHKSGIKYGYDDQFIETAQDWLLANGYLPGLELYSNGATEPLWYYCRDKHGIAWTRCAVNVSSRKEL